MTLGNDSGVAIAPGVEPVVRAIQFNRADFCRPACESFVCVIMLLDLLETHGAQLGDGFVVSMAQSGQAYLAKSAKAMNEHRQRSPSSHHPPHNIAIHVESVDPQPDGEKSVHGDSVMA